MQVADFAKNIFMTAALVMIGASSKALTPPAVGATPSSTKTPERAPDSAAIGAVKIGKKTGDDGKERLGTLAELEELQRQTALAEARKKLADLRGTPSPTSAIPSSSMPTSAPEERKPTVPAKGQKRGKDAATPPAVSPTPAVMPAQPLEELVQPPEAKFVNIMVVGARARADVVEQGRLITVKEGDKLGEWTITSITSAGVKVEQRRLRPAPPQMPQMQSSQPQAINSGVTVSAPMVGGQLRASGSTQPTLTPATKQTGGAKAPAAMTFLGAAVVAGAPTPAPTPAPTTTPMFGSQMQIEKVHVYMLKPATAQELALLAAPTMQSGTVTSGQSMLRPAGSADSTSASPARLLTPPGVVPPLPTLPTAQRAGG